MKLLATLACTLASAAAARAMELTSPDLVDGGTIATAQLYPGCGGRNVAPALSWSGTPEGTRSFVLTFIDTSVLPSGWSHWIAIDIPANVTSLPKGGALPEGAKGVGSNFGDPVYAGPCPPPATGTHRYEFTIYALDRMAPAIADNADANQLARALSAMALAKATLSGTAKPQH